MAKVAKNAALSPQTCRSIEQELLAVLDGLLPQPFYVVTVVLEKEMGHWHLRVFVERQTPEGRGETHENRISLQDCEAISRDIDGAVETFAPLAEIAFNLEVSSPGLNRSLTTPREFAFYQGQPVRIVGKVQCEEGAKKSSKKKGPPAPAPLPPGVPVEATEGILLGYEPTTSTVTIQPATNRGDATPVSVAFNPDVMEVCLNPHIELPPED